VASGALVLLVASVAFHFAAEGLEASAQAAAQTPGAGQTA
jgi:hypothetical protein